MHLDRCASKRRAYFEGSKVKKTERKDYSMTVGPLNRSERKEKEKKTDDPAHFLFRRRAEARSAGKLAEKTAA